MKLKIVMGGREFVIDVEDSSGFFDDDVLEGSRLGKHQVDLVGTKTIEEMEGVK